MRFEVRTNSRPNEGVQAMKRVAIDAIVLQVRCGALANSVIHS